MAWDAGNVIYAGRTLLGGSSSATVDLGSSSHKWRDIFWSEPTTGASGLFPLVTVNGRIMAKSNGYSGTCTGNPVVEFGLVVGCS